MKPVLDFESVKGQKRISFLLSMFMIGTGIYGIIKCSIENMTVIISPIHILLGIGMTVGGVLLWKYTWTKLSELPSKSSVSMEKED